MALGDGELDGTDLMFGLTGLLLIASAQRAGQIRAEEERALLDAAVAEEWAARQGVSFEVHQVIERGREIRAQRAWAEAIRRLTTGWQRVMRSIGWALLLWLPTMIVVVLLTPGGDPPDAMAWLVVLGIFVVSVRRYGRSHEAALERMHPSTRRDLHHHVGTGWHAHAWDPADRHHH